MRAQAAPAGRGTYRRFGLSLLLAAGLWMGAIPSSANAEDSPSPVAASDLVPTSARATSCYLDDLDRRTVALGAQSSDLVLVHFFATWCEPCRDELPALNRLIARSNSKKLRVLSISVAEVDVRVRNFVEKLPVHFPVLLDRDRSVAKSWNVSTLPTTFVLDRSHRPRLMIERDYDWDRFDVDEILKSFGS